jgi:ABC-type multidrug transport system permease subunit
MSALTTTSQTSPPARTSGLSPRRFVRDSGLLTGRSLRAIPRVPERLLDVTIQPIMFLLLFLYVFGSAIHVPGISYKNFLLPGIIGQTAAFGVISAGTATATDMSEGVIDRFRSMPIHRLAIITGEVVGQCCEQVLGMVITIGVGLALGWRPELTLLHGVELAALLAFAIFAFTWAGVLLGLCIKAPDAVQGAGFIIILPLSFMAGTFVQIQGMDLIPRTIAEWDPISALVGTARGLTTHLHSSGSLQLDHPELAMLGWCLILLVVCVPLALRRFNRVTAQ